jgi:hypothetical protein
MPSVAKKIPQIGASEQDFEQNEPKFPWFRQKGEPALWFMRFNLYLDLGPKRSLRKALAADPVQQKATKGDKKQSEPKKLSDVSVPGAWSRASKVWNWQERAAAYDLAEQAKRAGYLRETASRTHFASRAYRILQLDYMARVLKSFMPPPGVPVPEGKVAHYLAIMTRLQSVMRQMAIEMQGLDGVTANSCDEAAFNYVREEFEKQEADQAITIDHRPARR